MLCWIVEAKNIGTQNYLKPNLTEQGFNISSTIEFELSLEIQINLKQLSINQPQKINNNKKRSAEGEATITVLGSPNPSALFLRLKNQNVELNSKLVFFLPLDSLNCSSRKIFKS